MDEIFTEALNGSETGQAYKLLAAKRSGETNADERHHAWEAFAASFKNDYSDPVSYTHLPSASSVVRMWGSLSGETACGSMTTTERPCIH